MPEMRFQSIYSHGFCRVAAARHNVALAQPQKNADLILEILQKCHEQHVALAVFPELSLTGYSIDELFFQKTILDEALNALKKLITLSKKYNTVAIVGLPLLHGQTLYNCAAILHQGKLLGIVPKSHILSEGEFYEARYFASGKEISQQTILLWEEEYPFGTDLLFQAKDLPNLCFGLEICHDLWVPSAPGISLVNAGALLIANLSASPALVGRPKDRTLLCASYAQRLTAGYLYAASGWGESTNDLTWDGQLLICEAGNLLGVTSSPLPDAQTLLIRDIDLESLRAKRLKTNYFKQIPSETTQKAFRRISFKLKPKFKDIGFKRPFSAFPFHFLKEDENDRALETLNLQAAALAKRLIASHAQKMVIGISGGLDSALALLVCCRAAEILNWPYNQIVGCSLRGYGTSKTSEMLGLSLMNNLHISIHEIDIRPICQTVFKSLEHPASELPLTSFYTQDLDKRIFDLTFENVQAGIRTDLLFRLAGKENAIVVGTGDLSELALGWCTYGVGDQMAHYNVNAGLPKTLIQQLVNIFSQNDIFHRYNDETKHILKQIAERPISPELLPAQNEDCPQQTEISTGPYCIQDFILWHVLKHASSPERIFFLLEKNWGESCLNAENLDTNQPKFSKKVLLKCLEIFGKRFFNFSQFKRTAMPNGPKILPDIGLSPRGDWRAPSDLNCDIWQTQINEIKKIFHIS
ncbi:NAD(+) synthase [Acetobacteraceae bacterium]|nr:NAD(+) synthase [Acetobacteraceae bacterium]